MNQHQLLLCITQMGFALDDTILYLDTHPCDKKAMEYYEKTKELYQEAMCKYTMEYGPLEAKNCSCTDHWDWVMQPWPWE